MLHKKQYIIILSFCIILTGWMGTNTSSIELSRDDPQIQWWYDLNAPCFGSGATADFDNDGNLEITFGTYFNDEHVYALNADDGTLLWNYDTGGCNDASPVIADVDLDGELEVIIPASSPYEIYCFNGETGQVEWSTSTGYPNCIDSPPAVADVDNDGKPEVILGAWYGHVFCLDGEDGGINWQVNLGSDSYFQAGPNILDLDGDGALDIVLAQYSGDCRIYGLKGENGDVLWSSDLPQDYMYHGGSFADIDEDGLYEIAIGSYDEKVYVLNAEDGSLLWDYQAPYYIASPTSIADLNNDNHLELVFTSYNYLGVLSYTGDLLWSYTTGGSMFRGASIADIDGNGILDVVFGADDGILRVLQGSNGQEIWTLDLEAHYGQTYQIDNAPIIEDFNNDGTLDIFIIGGYGTSDPPTDNHGRGYAISAGDGTGEGWPMFRHDQYHSACFHFALNRQPQANDDYHCTLINTGTWINITQNDHDPDGTLDKSSIIITSPPAHGSAVANEITGNISYIPATGYTGTDTLQYTISDDAGYISNEALVTIYIMENNTPYTEIDMKSGWNLISIPLETNWTASDFITNITHCLMVSWFDAINQTFKTATTSGGYDFPLIPGWGYFTYNVHEIMYPIIGTPILNVSVPIELGWNMIGWYHDHNTTASSLMDNITGCIMVSWYDNGNETYRTSTSSGGYDFTVSQGLGLFVYTTEASVWYGEG